MRPCTRLLAAAALAWPAFALADPVGFAVGSGGDGFGGSSILYSVDLATGQATAVGPIGYVDVEGAALSPDGVLYAVADAGLACEGACGPTPTDLLLRIDTNTGQGSVAGALGLAGQGSGGNLDYGLAFTCDGSLWLSSDTTGQLWQVNPANGASQLSGTLGAPVSGLAGFGDALFGISVASDHALYRINPAAGTAERIGALGLPLAFYDAGLDFDAAGQLWATIDYWVPPPPNDLPEVERNDVALIDPDSGAASIVAAVVGNGFDASTVQMEGLALAAGAGCAVAPAAAVNVPVDRPLALLVLAGLLLGLAALRLRNQ